MAEHSTVARPYSQAIFKLARDQNKFAEWSDMLTFIEMLVSDSQLKSLISNTSIKKSQIFKLFAELGTKVFDNYGLNFVKILIENRRLEVIPSVLKQYEVLRAQAENTLDAELVSAFKIKGGLEKKIVDALEKRLGCKINLTTTVDETLLGGAIVHAGDLVIDGSAIARLRNLSYALAH
jgi:F-type H+-transporting ATPase subunit delta